MKLIKALVHLSILCTLLNPVNTIEYEEAYALLVI